MRRPAPLVIALVVIFALVASACGQQAASPAAPASAAPDLTAGEKPQSGGTLTFVVNAEPPSFDAHKETTFALLHPAAPHYSTLYRFDPNDLTKIVPDVALNCALQPLHLKMRRLS